MKKKSKKIPKNKSFFFKDYSEAEINFNSKEKKQIKVSDNRITFLFCVFISLIFIFTVKIIYLSLSPKKVFFSQKEEERV